LFVIIDIETTGNSPKHGQITEIAIYQHDGIKITGSFSSFVKPDMDIPLFITRLTGITNEMVKDAPRFYEIARKIVELTAGYTFVAHNVRFDYKFLQEEFARLGYQYNRKTLCTVKLSRKFFPGLQSYSLGKICHELGIEINNRHRAAGDALATVKLFELVLRKNEEQNKINAVNQVSLF
jgi:DNA polymerase III subunit epsilon